METTGRILTNEERAKVQQPFCRNHGKKWTLDVIRDHVVRGVEMAQQDQHTRAAIERGLRLVGQGAPNGA